MKLGSETLTRIEKILDTMKSFVEIGLGEEIHLKVLSLLRLESPLMEFEHQYEGRWRTSSYHAVTVKQKDGPFRHHLVCCSDDTVEIFACTEYGTFAYRENLISDPTLPDVIIFHDPAPSSDMVVDYSKTWTQAVFDGTLCRFPYVRDTLGRMYPADVALARKSS